MNIPLEDAFAAVKKPSPRLHSSHSCMEGTQRRLSMFNRRRLTPSLGDCNWREQLDQEAELREVEADFVEHERSFLAPLLDDVPRKPQDFMTWFESLRDTGPGQNDPLFPWLSDHASMDEMRWFLTQEVAGEAGFDDLVALTQIRMPVQAKLELARNYWDEMGRGHEDGLHGRMLEETVRELNLAPSQEGTVCEALALANMMVALATNRRFAYQSIGALGAIEMTAPCRVAQVNAGLHRLGVTPRGRRYFQLHAGLDMKHSEAWNAEVIQPLVNTLPETIPAIAEGALLRLRCGARCFARYRAELWLEMKSRKTESG